MIKQAQTPRLQIEGLILKLKTMKTIYYHVYSFYNSSRMTFQYVSSNKNEAEEESLRINNGYISIIERNHIDKSDIYMS